MKETSDVRQNMTSAVARNPQVQGLRRRYWRMNITLILVLLACWAVVGLGCGVLFADGLNRFKPFGGFPLGFWFAQQGSIIGFVLIILVYAIAMNVLDKKHHEALSRLRGDEASNPGQGPAGHDRALKESKECDRVTGGEGKRA